MKQILLNLLSNAIKYNRPDGSVTVIGKIKGKVICIEVVDSGIGISGEKMKDLFVPFSRLGQDDSGIEGTGIGLTITKELVGLMHGTLEVKSEVGVGSVFSVRIPMTEDLAEQNKLSFADTADGSKTSLEQKATLLYIEANPSNIQLMRDIVEQWPGVSLVVRKNAIKGIKAAVMLGPDLIFMDLHLPGMTGQAAFAELQMNPKTTKIPVIALSSDAMPATMQACLDMGFVSYLTKPIEIESLESEIEKCLHG